jgi:arylsulfatase A-like enzyme
MDPRAATRAALLALALSACGGDADDARWIHLARDGRPASDGYWHPRRVARAEWQIGGWPGVWSVACALPGRGAPPDDGPRVRLAAADEPFEYVVVAGDQLDPARIVPGTFAIVGSQLLIALDPDAAPPAEMTFEVFVGGGSERDGARHAEVEGYAGEGLALDADGRARWSGAIPKDSALRFAVALQSTAPHGAPEVTLGLRVLLDGEELARAAHAVGATPRHWRHEVPLPAGGRDRAELTFELVGDPSGDPGVGVVLSPVIGPLDAGRGSAAPDIVLFLADTFRADILGAYGGELGLTAELDRFTAASRVYTRAWSPSPWTLPSQTTMLTGLHPYQHGVVHRSRSIPDDLLTVVETLRDAGYRTGAVTDAGYVSPVYGFDQGFEWFQSRWSSLDDTLAGVTSFLDADDGRPVFLFVQTYQTHVPYVASEETRAAFGDRLQLDGDFFQVREELLDDVPNQGPADAEPDDLARLLPQFRDMYLGTVPDLDRAFGRLRRDLEARGAWDDTWLLFTSDHGEAFYEHRTIGHGNGVWEEHLRIPLVIHGPGVEPARVDYAAGLLDFPRTIARMAGVTPDRGWLGQDLLELDVERPVFAYECNNREDPSSAALIANGVKVIVPSGRAALSGDTIEHAYDLATDPGERDDIGHGADARPPELLRALAGEAARLYEPVTSTTGVSLTATQRANLRALGYVDDDE